MNRKFAMTAAAAVPIIAALALAPPVSAGGRSAGAGLKVYEATLTPLNAGTHVIDGRTLDIPPASGNATRPTVTPAIKSATNSSRV